MGNLLPLIARLLFAALLFVSYGVRAATENSPERNYQRRLNEENVAFLRELQKLIEQRGFRHVQIIPGLFVAKATDSRGNDRTLIINSDTLQAYAFDGPVPINNAPPETQVPELH